MSDVSDYINEYEPVYTLAEMDTALKEQREMCADDIKKISLLSGSIIHIDDAVDACLNATGEDL